MPESPHVRRLRSDYQSLERLRDDSRILDFQIDRYSPQGPPDQYTVRFYGKGLWRPEGQNDVLIREHHEVRVELGASYPRTGPNLAWKSPVFHPNISAGGIVCLGGYGAHWVPSLNLDELCEMLWDMTRYQNFDIASPYNREAAVWATQQKSYSLPVDERPIRDRVANRLRPIEPDLPPIVSEPMETDDIVILPAIDQEPADIVNAELVEAEVAAEFEDRDIVFLD